MSILPETKYSVIFTGSAIRVQYIQQELRQQGVNSIIANDGDSARRAGFGAHYDIEARLLAKKEDTILANRVLASILENDTDIPEDINSEMHVTDEAIEEAQKASNKPSRSNANLFINLALIAFSTYRLMPLFKGEEMPVWRIAISSGIIVICAVAIIMTLKNRSKA